MVMGESFQLAFDGEYFIAGGLVASVDDGVAVVDGIGVRHALGGSGLEHGDAHLVQRIVDVSAEAGARLGHGDHEGCLGDSLGGFLAR